jgi:tRNA-specific 2-thiouridylase
MSRVLMAMSGGVDSSVAAALLVEAGHEVIGVTMKTFCYSETPDSGKTCCGLDGIIDARRVSTALGIPHYVFDVEEDFTRDVIDDFVSEYARGRTPNPCVRCNSNTKFRDLLARGEALGCDRIATGHYVRISEGAEPPTLRRGLDAGKDQSYFLWGLPRQMLGDLLFPLGELTKKEVRARARALELATAEKPESQEICFVPMGDYRELLQRKLPERHPALLPGTIVRRTGEIVGEHAGYAGYTVGQRRGLGGGSPEPLFVLEVRPETREVVVGTRDELYSDRVVVGEVNWLMPAPEEGMRVEVQMRYRAPAVPAEVSYVDDSLVLSLDEGFRAVTPGQSAVVFDGDRVLGGGRIVEARSAATV